MTRVTIITPSFQQGAFLEDTLRSVLGQEIPGLEYLVIDGGSTDDTLGLLRRYKAAYPDALQWVSESDEGQSDAINKGFRRATGEIVAWLNADDIYYPGVLARAIDCFAQHPDVDVVYGRGTFVDRSGSFLTDFPHNQPFDAARLLDGHAFLLQPTVFWRRRALDTVGLLDPELHYSMDFDLWCRMAKAGLRFHYDAERYYAAARFYSDTKTASGHWRRARELRRVARRHGSHPLPAITFFSWLEAVMATRPARRCYRIFSLGAYGWPKDYWEQANPTVRGTFQICFPFYQALQGLEIEVAFGRTIHYGSPRRLTVSSGEEERVAVEVSSRRATVRVPWQGVDPLVQLTLREESGRVPYRVIRVRTVPEEAGS